MFIEGDEMKTMLSGYLATLDDQNPEIIGGQLPDDAFYYKTKSDRLPEISAENQFKKLSDNRNRRCQKDLLSQIHTCKQILYIIE